MTEQEARTTRDTRNANPKVVGSPLLFPLILVVVGVVLLLNNFYVVPDFNLVALLPLVLVVIGAVVLLRGDFVPSQAVRSFAITRGSVESATLEISAGEIDVEVGALQREGRLIAGQYAAESRPDLTVQDTHAQLRMDRAHTPWYTFADWQVGLSPDLPWQLFISTSIGRVNVDFTDVIAQDVMIATGIGEIRLHTPRESFGAVRVSSTLGDIYITTPHGYSSRIYAQSGRLFRVHVNEERYEMADAGVYVALDPAEDMPVVEIYISGTFGDAYLV